MRPKFIKQVIPLELTIDWDDGHKGRHRLSTLRKYCPCASCKARMEVGEGVLLLPDLQPGQGELRSIEHAGSYALQMVWGDGHRTGFYTFEYLRELCECDECNPIAGE